ncbi:hypothetical protein [Streptomyces sp. NPDC049970]|uniref:hypothetical protein n=1 Tax=Streptomyces sp. NPDC049970 TaxID=3155033 RepID=UPI0034328A04
MPHYDERLSGIEERPHDDERSSGPRDRRSRHDERPGGTESRPRTGDPEHPVAPRRGASRGRHDGLVLLWLAVGVVALLAGIFIGHGLLIAAGLVVAGMAGQLLDPRRTRSASRVPRCR